MRACAGCGGPVERAFRFCPWCSEPQRVKITEFFRAHAAIQSDAGKALRVSRYLADRHVRFSVWDESGRAAAAVSIDEAEAARLASFLPHAASRHSLLERLGL